MGAKMIKLSEQYMAGELTHAEYDAMVILTLAGVL